MCLPDKIKIRETWDPPPTSVGKISNSTGISVSVLILYIGESQILREFSPNGHRNLNLIYSCLSAFFALLLLATAISRFSDHLKISSKTQLILVS